MPEANIANHAILVCLPAARNDLAGGWAAHSALSCIPVMSLAPKFHFPTDLLFGSKCAMALANTVQPFYSKGVLAVSWLSSVLYQGSLSEKAGNGKRGSVSRCSLNDYSVSP